MGTKHAETTYQTVDDHHDQAHTHAGGAEGTITHSATTGRTTDDHHNQTHAPTHKDGGNDELDVEELASAGAANTFPRADGSGAVTMTTISHAEATGKGTDDHHAESHDYDTHSGGVPFAELEYDDATSDPLIDGAAAADGTEGSAARKDHVHPRHHAIYVDASAVSAVEAAGLDLVAGKDVMLTENLTSDHTWSGITAYMYASESVVLGEICYFKAANWLEKADADSIAKMPVVAMALETITAINRGKFLLFGIVRDDSWSWTQGAPIYASTTLGDLTQTPPSGTGDQVQVVGVALWEGVTMLFNPDYTLIEIA